MSKNGKIENQFKILLSSGDISEVSAGSIEVGPAGELRINEVYWSLVQTMSRTVQVIAPGRWEAYEWVKK